MSAKRVSFLQSLTADPQWRQKAGLDARPIEQSRSADSRVEPRVASPERRPAVEAAEVSRPQRSVSSTSSRESDSQEAIGISRGSSVNTLAGHERLERINAQFGTVCAYDGRYCVWTTRDNGRTRDSYDVRDIAKRLHITMHDVVDSLPEFKPVKRGRASETPDESFTE